MILSSVAHDVDHPGNANQFEINSQSDMSLMYKGIGEFALLLTAPTHPLTRIPSHPSTHLLAHCLLSHLPTFSVLSNMPSHPSHHGSSASCVGESSLRDDVSNTTKNEKQLPVDAATGNMSRGNCCCCWITIVLTVIFSY